MEHIDSRVLNNDELFAVRKQVVRLKLQGKKGAEIEECTGVYQTRISQIWKAYQDGGINGIRPKKSGRKAKSQMILTRDEQKLIRETIISKTPNQLKLAGFLWTLEKISSHIWSVCRKKVSARCLSNYMKRWGLTCQRPTKRAFGQDIARIERFKKEEYPAIAARAKAERADIFWGDETGVSNRENYERGFSERGQTPVLPMVTKKETANMISAICNKGHVRFMVYTGSMNQKRFIDFLRRLVSDASRKVFLIIDNLKVHHGKIVAAWLEEHKDEIEVFFLPPYAPESNPDEYLNHALKRSVHSGNLPRNEKEIKHKIHSYMRRLQHKKERVCAFFKHKNVVYCCVQE